MSDSPQCKDGCQHDEHCWRFWSQKARTIAADLTALRADVERLTRERDEAQFLLNGANVVRQADNKYLIARAEAAEAERDRLRAALDSIMIANAALGETGEKG